MCKHAKTTNERAQTVNLYIPQKHFFTAFFGEKLRFDPFQPNEDPTPHNIHRWKAMDLSFLTQSNIL